MSLICKFCKFHIDWEFHQYFSPPRHLGLQSATLNHRLVLFASHKYGLKFQNSNQPGFEPGCPGPKAATLASCYSTLTSGFSYLFQLLFHVFTFFSFTSTISSSFLFLRNENLTLHDFLLFFPLIFLLCVPILSYYYFF